MNENSIHNNGIQTSRHRVTGFLGGLTGTFLGGSAWLPVLIYQLAEDQKSLTIPVALLTSITLSYIYFAFRVTTDETITRPKAVRYCCVLLILIVISAFGAYATLPDQFAQATEWQSQLLLAGVTGMILSLVVWFFQGRSE